MSDKSDREWPFPTGDGHDCVSRSGEACRASGVPAEPCGLFEAWYGSQDDAFTGSCDEATARRVWEGAESLIRPSQQCEGCCRGLPLDDGVHRDTGGVSVVCAAPAAQAQPEPSSSLGVPASPSGSALQPPSGASASIPNAKSLLHQPVSHISEISKTIPGGCYCPPDRCSAPVIMGRQTPCLRRKQEQ